MPVVERAQDGRERCPCRTGQRGTYDAARQSPGFAHDAMAEALFPSFVETVDRLRNVLGTSRYNELAQAGAGMEPATIANHAQEQIELIRSTLGTSWTPADNGHPIPPNTRVIHLVSPCISLAAGSVRG
ncbi:MAG TPA: hypothetical protein VM282_10515 [Acidimicrobiales bacterium]|nr:hypothetical protein [Acidimicrobiales bacterium]